MMTLVAWSYNVNLKLALSLGIWASGEKSAKLKALAFIGQEESALFHVPK